MVLWYFNLGFTPKRGWPLGNTSVKYKVMAFTFDTNPGPKSDIFGSFFKDGSRSSAMKLWYLTKILYGNTYLASRNPPLEFHPNLSWQL